MKKWLLVVTVLPLFVIAQSSKTVVKPKTTAKPVAKPVPGFVITGKVDGGYPDGMSVILYKNGENVGMATTTVQKGKFTLKGSVTEPTLCFLVIGEEKPSEVYIENKNITYKADRAHPGRYEVEGSASHKDFSAFISLFMPLAQQLGSLATSINSTQPGPQRDELMNQYTKQQENIQKEIDKYITKYPKSLVSTFVLNVTYQFNEDPTILEERFKKLDATVRKSESGKQLETFIAESKIGAVGTPAIDFSQPDTTGAMISLSSFRGKYVLVDFWASWCGPCRDENPNLVKNYQEFSNKNFTVLGVSLDRPGQKAKWLEAIRVDSLTWTHVSDLQFWNNSAAQLYKIKGIPQNILVDPNGKIVAKNLRGPALHAKLCEILGCETKPF